jgi:hypothetical protein
VIEVCPGLEEPATVETYIRAAPRIRGFPRLEGEASTEFFSDDASPVASQRGRSRADSPGNGGTGDGE